MKRLLVDVDGVVADLHGAVLKIFNDEHGTNHSNEEIVMWDFFKKGKGIFKEDQHCDDMVEIFKRPGLVRGLGVLPHAVEVLERLAARYDIVWVSAPYNASPTWCHDRTRWIGANFSHISTKIVYTDQKDIINGDVLIDDKIDNVLEFTDGQTNGRRAILFDQPWNRYLRGVAPRAQGWLEVESMLD